MTRRRCEDFNACKGALDRVFGRKRKIRVTLDTLRTMPCERRNSYVLWLLAHADDRCGTRLYRKLDRKISKVIPGYDLVSVEKIYPFVCEAIQVLAKRYGTVT